MILVVVGEELLGFLPLLGGIEGTLGQARDVHCLAGTFQ